MWCPHYRRRTDKMILSLYSEVPFGTAAREATCSSPNRVRAAPWLQTGSWSHRRLHPGRESREGFLRSGWAV
jgi:hypothetical protein